MKLGGGDVRKLEPKKWLKFTDIDKSIQELRAIFKVHPEWFETPRPKSDKGKNIGIIQFNKPVFCKKYIRAK
jgi:hypothetical protein